MNILLKPVLDDSGQPEPIEELYNADVDHRQFNVVVWRTSIHRGVLQVRELRTGQIFDERHVVISGDHATQTDIMLNEFRWRQLALESIDAFTFFRDYDFD